MPLSAACKLKRPSPALGLTSNQGQDPGEFLPCQDTNPSEVRRVIFESSVHNLIPRFQELHWHPRPLQAAIY